ncbi:MAG: PilW family protein, partial [Planctomycetota bacterium]
MKNTRSALRGALTLTEMVIAMAIAAIVFAVVLPQLRVIQNSWDSREGASETLQNGRVLMDHLHRRLSKAVRINGVSGPSETNGYIEFQASDGNNMRYDIAADNHVEFGMVGNPANLAGPVSRLQFTCYDAFDLTTPITDVNSIRCVKVQATLTNLAKVDQDMTFTTQAYIRTNALPAAGGGISKKSAPWPEFDPVTGQYPALAKISDTEYLCAYRGDGYDGWACIVTVNPADWSVSAATFLEYDTKDVQTPALAKIDDTHLLCAYVGDKTDGFACVLEYTGPATLSKRSSLEFYTADCSTPALCQIDT